MKNIFFKLFKNFLLLLFPDRCIICNILLASNGSFCIKCWKKISFISNFYCKICGSKILIAPDIEYICAHCVKNPPQMQRLRFLFDFDQNISKLIHKFKYYDNTNLAEIFANLFLNRYKKEFYDIDAIVPVPMHWIKRLYRKYNPPEILAKEISKKLSHKKFVVNALIKTKNTQSQTYLTKKQRLINIKNSITINSKYSLKNKVILLIDDVYTTGVTANLCASLLLKKHKVKEVKFFALAKVGKNFTNI